MSSLAERLWQARVSGELVEVAPGEAPVDIPSAFRIQDEVAQAGGLPRGGWKVGATSKGSMEKLGSTEPAPAPMYKADCHASPAEVPVFVKHAPMIEAELAFVMAKDLPPREKPYNDEEVAAAIGGIAPCFEVVGTRLTTGMLSSGRLMLLADNGSNIGFVGGEWTRDWRQHDLPKVSLTMTLNGEEVGGGIGAKAMGDPFNVMVWLANHLSKRGYGLHEGEVISSGSLSDQFYVKPGDVSEADFGPLGRVKVSIVAARK